MKKRTATLLRALIVVFGIVPFLGGCDSRLYEKCPPSRIFGYWGVTDDTHTFGQYDSLYYLINPIGNVADSVYYNGNYSDSYYHSDPVRVLLRYTLEDSINLNLERLYATEINPLNLVVLVSDESDSLDRECVLHMKRDEDNGNLYRCGPDSLFKEMLRSGHVLKVAATNGNSSSEPQGSQNYDFEIYTEGFDKALQLADSLNPHKKKEEKRTLRKDIDQSRH